MDWNAQDLLKLRQVLQVHGTGDIETTLTKYTEMVELFSCHFPHWAVSARVDWSIAVAMAPAWFFSTSLLSSLYFLGSVNLSQLVSTIRCLYRHF
jgi:hypothetical protein